MISKLLILLVYNIHKVTTILFGAALLTVAFIRLLSGLMPVLLAYIFWFALGAYTFSVCVRWCIQFLNKKYKEKNAFYLKLLEKQNNKNRLWVSYKKDNK